MFPESIAQMLKSRVRRSASAAVFAAAAASADAVAGTLREFEISLARDLDAVEYESFVTDSEGVPAMVDDAPITRCGPARYVWGVAALSGYTPTVIGRLFRHKRPMGISGSVEPLSIDDYTDVNYCVEHDIFYECTQESVCMRCVDAGVMFTPNVLDRDLVPYTRIRGSELIPTYVGREYLNGIPRHHWYLSSQSVLTCACGSSDHEFEFDGFPPIWFKPPASFAYALFPTSLREEGETSSLVLSSFGYIVGRYGKRQQSQVPAGQVARSSVSLGL
ncbi:ORF2 [Maize-associated pteridovirus]|uniref:ORF2 n=1 Tax=Maize-associated pteridovirus TaxID=2497338 RepID=A0A3Q9D1K1_9VIRU|nr:ORF2 [Maize-associated pteridovirus]AZP55490.1 ORF2 [Maize-associated pteridovirus]QJD25918.1 ORF2 protein [Maize pteridovirus]